MTVKNWLDLFNFCSASFSRNGKLQSIYTSRVSCNHPKAFLIYCMWEEIALSPSTLLQLLQFFSFQRILFKGCLCVQWFSDMKMDFFFFFFCTNQYYCSFFCFFVLVTGCVKCKAPLIQLDVQKCDISLDSVRVIVVCSESDCMSRQL